MAKKSAGKKKTARPPARVARAVPAIPEEPIPVGTSLPPAEELPAAESIDQALDAFLPPPEEPAASPEPAPAAAPPAEPAAAAEVGQLPPHLRKRTGRPGRRTRRELEKEVKNLREYLQQVAPGDGGPEEPAAAAPVVIDTTEAGELVGFVLDMIFEAVADERGDHWRMSEQKLARAKEHGGKALGPFLPKLGNLLPWVFFAGVVGKHSLSAWKVDRERGKRNGPPASPTPAAVSSAPVPAANDASSGGVH